MDVRNNHCFATVLSRQYTLTTTKTGNVMKTTIQAKDLKVGMSIGFRTVVAVCQVKNGDVYAKYEALGLFPKRVRMTQRQLIEVRI